jgi:hypothetical protein
MFDVLGKNIIRIYFLFFSFIFRYFFLFLSILKSILSLWMKGEKWRSILCSMFTYIHSNMWPPSRFCFEKKRIVKQFLFFFLEIGDLGLFLFGKNLVSRTTMQRSHQPSYNSGQQSFARTQLRSLGIIPSVQPQQKSTQQNDYYNNSNIQQLSNTL